MTVTIEDQINKSLEDKINVVLQDTRYVARLISDRKDVKVNDAYGITPKSKRLTVDYLLPESITSGLFVDIEDLRTDLTTEIGDREVAIIGATTYTDTETAQVLTTVEATYVNNTELDALVLAIDFSNYEITTQDGFTTASFQEIHDRLVEVDGNFAGYTEDLQLVTTDMYSSAGKVETLTASSGDTAVRLEKLEKVAAGEFPLWVITSTLTDVLADIGTVIYTTDSSPPNANPNPTNTSQIANSIPATGNGVKYTKWLWVGQTLDVDGTNDGWREIENVQADFGVAKNVYIDTNGDITGWGYSDTGSGSGEFKILATNFSISDGTSIVNTPFSVVAGTPNKVTTTGINITLNGAVTSSTHCTIIGGKITTLTTRTVDENNVTADGQTHFYVWNTTTWAELMTVGKASSGDIWVTEIRNQGINAVPLRADSSNSSTTAYITNTGTAVALLVEAAAEDAVVVTTDGHNTAVKGTGGSGYSGAIGVYGTAAIGIGVKGLATTGVGVEGISTSSGGGSSGIGVRGGATNGTGVLGYSTDGAGGVFNTISGAYALLVNKSIKYGGVSIWNGTPATTVSEGTMAISDGDMLTIIMGNAATAATTTEYFTVTIDVYTSTKINTGSFGGTAACSWNGTTSTFTNSVSLWFYQILRYGVK